VNFTLFSTLYGFSHEGWTGHAWRQSAHASTGSIASPAPPPCRNQPMRSQQIKLRARLCVDRGAFDKAWAQYEKRTRGRR